MVSRRSRRDDLLGAATELFSEHGYDRTTVRMIADRLGVLSGSLYSHISRKEEVLYEIVLQVADDFLTRAKAVRGRGEDPLPTVRSLCREHLRVLHERQPAVTVYYDQWKQLDDQRRATIARLRKDYEAHFTAAIEAGVASGAFRRVDVHAAVLVLLSACNWTYQWYSSSGHWQPDEIADRYVDVIAEGLRR